MNAEYLEQKWASINKKNIHGYRIIRISPDSKTELNIGYRDNDNRCLVLELPRSGNFDFKGTIRQNLALDYVNEFKYIVIELTDSTFYDLFNDLIVSLFQRIKDIDSVDLSAKELISAFYKWSEFFNSKQILSLNEQTIKGLFGELIFLRDLLDESIMTTVNEILESWKGPFGKGHDFILPHANFEVKSKDKNNIDVYISSEFQLQPEFEKDLNLVVIELEKDFADGHSLSELFQSVRGLIISKMGDTSIFLRCIAQHGLNSKNITDYDASKFKAISRSDYRATAEGFPKLIKDEIPKEISNLKFNLRVTSLAKFIIYQKSY